MSVLGEPEALTFHRFGRLEFRLGSQPNCQATTVTFT